MTNGEKFIQTFSISQIDEGELYTYVWLPNHDAVEFSIDWWNAEYKEPIKALEQESTTRNCFGCKYSKDNHNAGTEECHLCMWENQYTPTTKNDLGVDCINRDNAIKALDYDIKCFEFKRGVNRHMDDIAKLLNTIYETQVNNIKALPSVTPQEPRWIPVSEYLPVTNDEVLVTYIVNGNTKKRYVETANCFNGEWCSVNDEYRIPNTKIEIIAWCEMPKPYKAEK